LAAEKEDISEFEILRFSGVFEETLNADSEI
jgi:hypothetical protein